MVHKGGKSGFMKAGLVDVWVRNAKEILHCKNLKSSESILMWLMHSQFLYNYHIADVAHGGMITVCECS